MGLAFWRKACKNDILEMSPCIDGRDVRDLIGTHWVHEIQTQSSAFEALSLALRGQAHGNSQGSCNGA